MLVVSGRNTLDFLPSSYYAKRQRPRIVVCINLDTWTLDTKQKTRKTLCKQTKHPYSHRPWEYPVNIEGKHIKSQYRQPTNKWYIMKIYYRPCPRKRATDLNVIQINITVIERRHGLSEIVKFITVLMRIFCMQQYVACYRLALRNQ